MADNNKIYWHWRGPGWYAPKIENGIRHEYRVDTDINNDEWREYGDNAPSVIAKRDGFGAPAEYVDDLPMNTGGHYGLFVEELEED